MRVPEESYPAKPQEGVSHASSAEDVVRAHETHPERGLTDQQVHERRLVHGGTVLQREARLPWWYGFARQFTDLIVLILVAAAVISGVLGEWLDAVVILAIVFLNAVLSFIQEERAEQAIAA